MHEVVALVKGPVFVQTGVCPTKTTIFDAATVERYWSADAMEPTVTVIRPFVAITPVIAAAVGAASATEPVVSTVAFPVGTAA